MKPHATKRRSRWFWVGMVLLSISALAWLAIMSQVVSGVEDAVNSALAALLLTAVPIGIGIYCVVRYRRPEPVDERRREEIVAKRKATLLDVLGWLVLIACIAGILVLIYASLNLGLSEWLVILALLGGALGVNVFFGLIAMFKQRILAKAGYGIKGLEALGARVGAPLDKAGSTSEAAVLTLRDRKVVADVVTINEYVPSPPSYSADVAYTRICVEHRGEIPCVTVVPILGRMRFFDQHIYMEWRKKHGYPLALYEHNLTIPKKVKISGRKVTTALPKEIVPIATEWAKRILDDPNMAALGGFLRIEPEEVLWLRKGGLLEKNLLENAVNVLVGLAEKIERED